ncbi:MAG: DUF1573 domain-containing protein, partial [Chitinophagia bacterium]|nr:DUF1573 domain-containing protein [Chitinophagia bacterium]
PKTTIQFYETKYSFGAVSAGKLLSHVFRFKNTGMNPLMIGKTDVTCNCTVTYFTMEAIPPGGDGELTVNFDSQGQKDYQQKNVIVHSNTLPESVSIGIDADVKP